MVGAINTEAVMFFHDGVVIKEMLYPEFEALLDQVVGVPEFTGKEVKAAFLRINPQLKLRAAVFFKIDFDAKGYVNKYWNIPLGHLADNAGKGPDLGAGPIKLSCRSQCSVSWHQRTLWDPELDRKPNTLESITSALTRNRLGLEKIEEEDLADFSFSAKDGQKGDFGDKASRELKASLEKQFQRELKDRVSSLQQEYKLRVASMKAEAQEYLERVHHHYREEQASLKESIATTKQLFTEEKNKNSRLKSMLDQQAAAMQQTREQLLGELEEVRDGEQNKLTELMARFELEKQSAVNTAKAELKEMLDMREVELFYREEQLSNLREEVGQLRQEKQIMLNESGDRLLQKLASAGITYVAYHAGIDPVSVPLVDIGRYLESPVSYVAEKCGVDVDLYQHWLSHYELPVCNFRDANGITCGDPIRKVSKPGRFIAGESDRCSKHARFTEAVASVIKMSEKT